MSKIKHIVTNLSTKWYFFPIIGVVFLILVNGFVFAGIMLTKNKSASDSAKQTNKSQEDSVTDPSPTPLATANPTPSASPRPTPTPVLSTPTSKPKPTPTPIPETKQTIRINKPKNEQNIEAQEFEVELEPVTSKQILKVEVLVNGSVKHDFANSPFSTKIKLDPGKYQLSTRMFLSDGSSVDGDSVKIGVGGVKWNQPDPTPTPTPSPSPTPTPTPSPSPSASPEILSE